MLTAIESENYRLAREGSHNLSYKIEAKYTPDDAIEIDVSDIDEMIELLQQAKKILPFPSK